MAFLLLFKLFYGSGVHFPSAPPFDSHRVFWTISVGIPKCPLAFFELKLLLCLTWSQHSQVPMWAHIVEKIHIIRNIPLQIIDRVIVVMGELLPFHAWEEGLSNRIVQWRSRIWKWLVHAEITQMFAECVCGILRSLIGMKRQVVRTMALFKCNPPV